MINEHCSNCKYFGVDVVSGYVVCRRYAPHILCGAGNGYSDQRFPTVGQDEWCGEWVNIVIYEPPEVE